MFEIGDKVIVKTVDELCNDFELYDVYDVKYINTPYLSFIEEMYQYAGKEAVITKKIIIEAENNKCIYKINIDPKWKYTDEMLKSSIKDSSRFADAQIGDKVYSRVDGDGEIVAITDKIIKCKFNSTVFGYTKTGKLSHENKESILFYRDETSSYLTKRPSLKVPWDKVPIDTKVEANFGNNNWYKRYYAGNMKIFNNGTTSWSLQGEIIVEKIRLAEDIVIDGVKYSKGSE